MERKVPAAEYFLNQCLVIVRSGNWLLLKKEVAYGIEKYFVRGK